MTVDLPAWRRLRHLWYWQAFFMVCMITSMFVAPIGMTVVYMICLRGTTFFYDNQPE